MTRTAVIVNGDINCPCGNTSDYFGFFPCLADGTLDDASVDGSWDGIHYRCDACDAIIDQDTGEIKEEA